MSADRGRPKSGPPAEDNATQANLRGSDKNDQYVSLIIRKGGAALGRSEFMPTWEAELTEEQVRDLVAYLRSINMNTPR